MVITFVQITERKRAEGVLREDDRRREEFLAVLAHELRNPLAVLHNGVSLLKDVRREPGQFERTTGMIERQVDLLTRLIDDLLGVTRISQGKFELRTSTVDLVEVLEHALENCRARFGARHVEFERPPAPIRLEGDPTRLMQVFVNLLNNAVDHTSEDGRIHLEIEPDGRQAVVSVEDDGTGIAPHELEMIFEMFVQGSQTLPDTAQRGLGIGLTLVRRIVALHGGRVDAVSKGRGKGSRFTVRLPIAKEVGSPDRRPERQMAAASGMRILVVDDNEDAARVLADLLELAGNEVLTAHDGAGALKSAASFAPDVVLLDIGLPGIDGYEVARSLRAHPNGKDVALVAVTGWGQESDFARSQAAGFDRHLVKPVEHRALLELLAELREQRQSNVR